TIEVQIPQHRIRAAYEASRGAPGAMQFLYPVIVPPKGIFYDNLRIYDGTGRSLPTLSYREYLYVAASVIHLLIAGACGTAPDQLPEDAIDGERQAIWGLIRRIDTKAAYAADGPGTVADIEHEGREIATELRRLRSVQNDPIRRSAIR